MKWVARILLLLPLALGCVEPIPLLETPAEQRLLVDGVITQEPGPHQVRLFQTPASITDSLRSFNGAQVSILVDGNAASPVVLRSGNYGTYYTPLGWQAAYGHRYQLIIETTDGLKYISEDQELYPSGQIDSVRVAYEPNVINPDNASKPQDVLNLLAFGKGSPGYPNLLRWRWKGTYEVRTFPESNTMQVGGVIVPAPLPCSFERINDRGVLKICSCCTCWVTEKSNVPLVYRHKLAGEYRLDHISLGYIPWEEFRLSMRYHLEVEQLSLSPAAYHFWSQVETQQQGASNLFQPSAIKIRGNMKSLTRPDEVVYGIFSVSGVTRLSRFLRSGETRSASVGAPPFVTRDCREYFDRSTNQRPPFW